MELKEKEFWDAAQNWYRRTHRLREITESKDESDKRRNKALRLFLEMHNRMFKVTSMAVRLQSPVITGLKQGGI